jgi:hypothetical protein
VVTADDDMAGLVPLRWPGLLIGPREAWHLARALDLLLGMQQRANGGGQLSSVAARCRAQLYALGELYERGEAPRTDVDVSASVPMAPDRAPSSHDLVTSVEAAELLGCKAHNVRDLRRRERLGGHQRGGRWWFDRGEVLELRDARRNHREV